tara:strand:- start:293 stop:829 length:537 start_codon:yes stop_codon:yes gene_type:complete
MGNTNQTKMLAFHGDYSALKGMGFTFQKLYADNYMQWELETRKHLSSVRIWKRQPQVTVDCLTNFEGSFFQLLLDYRTAGKPLSITSLQCIECVKDLDTYSVLMGDEAKALYRAQQQAFIDYLDQSNDGNDKSVPEPQHRYEMLIVAPADIQPVMNLIDMGWISIVNIPPTNNNQARS